MPWNSTKEGTVPSLQNKSIEIRQLFAKVANEALNKGQSEEEATYAGLAAVKIKEKQKEKADKAQKALAEPTRAIPQHLQAVLDLLNAPEQPTSDDNYSGNTNVALVVKNALSPLVGMGQALTPDSDRSLIAADFDSAGRLVLRFDTGEAITTTEGNIREYIERIVTIAAPAATGGGGGGDLPTNISSPQDGQVLVYNADTAAWENKILEDLEVQAKRVDFVGEDIIYKAEAAVGTADSASVWRIRKIVIAADGDVTETWASGNSNYDKVWNNHASYTYS